MLVDVEKLEPLYIVGESVKWCSTVENTLAAPQKVKHELPYDPAILLLGI